MEQRMPQKWFSPFSLLDELENIQWPAINGPNWQHQSQGLQISEDDNNVYVEAALPGLNEGDIDVTFEKGNLMIRGEKKETEEDKKKKYWRRSSRSFVYHLSVPGNVDENHEPQAEFKNGIAKITFAKQKKAQPRKIEFKKK
jgi:HSP20 family protein